MGPEALIAEAERIARAARAWGADDAEAYVWRSRTVEASVLGARASGRASASAGVGLRVVRGGRLGYGACASLDEGCVRRAVRDALESAQAGAPGLGDEALPEPRPGRGPPGPFDEALAAAQPADAVRDLLPVAAALRAADVVYSSATLLHVTYAFGVASTRGVAAGDRGTETRAALEGRVRRGAEEREASVGLVGRHRLDLAGAGPDCLARARRALGARALPPGTYDVVADPAAAALLLRPLAQALRGPSAAERRSPLAGRLGERVASPLLTVRDAPRAGGLRAAAFDDEGMPSRERVLLEGGVLRAWLHDGASARRAGPPAEPGNALRLGDERHRVPPSPTPMTLTVDPGSKAFEDLVAEVDRGILVAHHLMGAVHVDPSTGFLSLVAPTAWWVERGEVCHALRPTTLAASAMDALQRVRGVGRDAELTGLGKLPALWMGGFACAA